MVAQHTSETGKAKLGLRQGALNLDFPFGLSILLQKVRSGRHAGLAGPLAAKLHLTTDGYEWLSGTPGLIVSDGPLMPVFSIQFDVDV